jgi:exopolysaccharide biosynthesis protein
VDGRHPPRNCGATLAELAKIMLELHCVHAMNLDGGGSTTMVVGDEIVNTPSDGREREVSTGILVLPGDAPQTQAGVESASN